MPKRTRSSRTTAASTATLPPCEFMKISLRQPVARHALADLGPGAHDRLHREGQRAGIVQVLVRLADRLDGQEQRRQVVGNPRDGALEIALVDERVDADRKMRPMLLDRRDRQHRHDLASCRRLKNRSTSSLPKIWSATCLVSRLASGDRLDLDDELRTGEALNDHQRRGRRRRRARIRRAPACSRPSVRARSHRR